MTYWIVFGTVYLRFCLLIIDTVFYGFWSSSSASTPFFYIKTSQNFAEVKFSASNCSYHVLFFMNHSYLLTAKITLDFNTRFFYKQHLISNARLKLAKNQAKAKQPSRLLLVQNQQWKHQNNVWNLFKVTNKDSRTPSFKSFWCFYC